MAENKGLFKRFYNWSFLLIVIVGILLVNIISSFVYERFDMTEDQRYSLAPGTIDYLNNEENFNNRLLIKIYLAGELPAEINRFKVAIEDKLKEFKQYAGKRIEYEFIDPHSGTKEENNELYQNLFAEGEGLLPSYLMYRKDGSQSKLMLWPGAVIEYGGSTVNTIQFLPGSKPKTTYQLNMMDEMIQNAINNLEYMLISSIRRATQEKKSRIAFLEGHGELTYQQTQRARALLSPYYSVADVKIGDSVNALDEVDGLIIARPTRKFSENELFLIDQFLMNGGKLMCFLDKLNFPRDSIMTPNYESHTTRIDIGLEKMLYSYGLAVKDNYVLDARCGFKQVPFQERPAIPWFYHVIATPTNHPIARNLEPVSLEYVNEVSFASNNPNVVLRPVLTSSTNSTVTGLAPTVNLGLPLNYDPKKPELAMNPEDENNKKCLAGLAEGHFVSYFKNRINPEYVAKIVKADKNKTVRDSSIQEGKVFVVGNGRFLENAYDSLLLRDSSGYQYRPNQFNDLQRSVDMTNLQIPHLFGNQEFIQNIMDYMMDETSVLDLRSRQIDIHQINNEMVVLHASYYKLLNIGLPIFVILAMAFLINAIRKRKYAA